MISRWAQALFLAALIGGIGWWWFAAAPRSHPARPEADAGGSPPEAAQPTEAAPRPEPPGGPETAAAAESPAAREARLAVLRLRKKNEDLREEVLDLRSQVDTLTGLLASEKSRADQLRMQLRTSRVGGISPPKPAVSTLAGQAFPVLEADESLNLVVIGAGHRAGIRPGMRFRLMDEEDAIGWARAEEVRRSLTGAEVEPGAERFPEAGDRALPRTRTD